MARYDLAGNALPESSASPPPAAPPPPVYEAGPAPAPAYTPRSPAPPPSSAAAPAPWCAPATPQSILIRGVVQETPAQKVRAYGGLLGTFLLLIALTYAVAAIPAPRIPAPDSYTKHTVSLGGFTYDAPDGWSRHATEGEIVYKYHNRKALLQIDYIPTDALGTGSLPSLDMAHARGLGIVTDDLGDIPLHDLPAQAVTTGLGEGRLSEWTVSAGLTRLHGYRASLVGPGQEAFVTCFCPERDWAGLQPSFLHVIQSATPIGGVPPPPLGGQNGGM